MPVSFSPAELHTNVTNFPIGDTDPALETGMIGNVAPRFEGFKPVIIL